MILCKDRMQNKKDEEMNRMKEEIAQLKQELQLRENSGHITNNNTTINNTNNNNITNNITIVLNDFGKEDITHIMDDKNFLEDCLKELFTSAI